MMTGVLGWPRRGVEPLILNEPCYTWQYFAENANGQTLLKRKVAAPRGSLWGGTSAINAALWYRGTKSGTYDIWENLAGPEWGYDAMNSAYVKVENRTQSNVALGASPVAYFNGAAPVNTIKPDKQGTTGKLFLTVTGELVNQPSVAGSYDALKSVLDEVFPGRFALYADPDEAVVPETYTSVLRSQYDQTDPSFGSTVNPGHNPYALLPNGGIGQSYIPPFDVSNAKGPEYFGLPLVVTPSSAIPDNGSTGGIKDLLARCYAAPAYIYPVVTKKEYDAKKDAVVDLPNNVTIKSGAYLTKLLFDDENPNEVIGVEYVVNGWHVNEINRNIRTEGPKATANKIQTVENQKLAKTFRAYAAADIFLCGGAVESPAILQRNGIGPREHLESLNDPVACRVNLPGVGNHLQDHPDFQVNWHQEVNYEVFGGLPINELFYNGFTSGPADTDSFDTASIQGFLGTSDTLLFKTDPTKKFLNMAMLIGQLPVFSGVIGGYYSWEQWYDEPFVGAYANFDTLPGYDFTQYGSLSVPPKPSTNISGAFFELFQSQGEGSCLIKSANPFEPPVYAPNLINNEDDMQARVEAFKNTGWPLIQSLSTKRYGPDSSDSRTIVSLNGPNNRNFVRMLWPPSNVFLSPTNEQTLDTPFTTQSGDATVTVTMPDHGFKVADTILIQDAITFNNIPAEKLNDYHQVSAVIDQDTFQIIVDNLQGYDPSVIVAGSGGGDSVVIKALAFNESGFREFLFNNTFEGWHSSSTCKMGMPSNSEAVVDSHCRVYNVCGLRVCDASIFPACPNSNTQAPCYGVAQRLSDLVKPEYKKLFSKECKKYKKHKKHY